VNQPLLQMDLRLVGAAIVVLAAAVIAIWFIGRRLRSDLGPARNAPNVGAAAAPGPGIPSHVVKELQARGLATPAQLASMSETERQLLFGAVAGAIAREADGASDDAFRSASARSVVRPEELPTLFCPLCAYRIESFTSVPPVTGQCETCGAKVVVRKDASRILLTVLPPGARQDLRV
jgi:hypothetical protein